ncbi:hypothetical protein BHM03_00016906 [Ensete ventricosum]|nr:hypothetical protein BHM03_00016906 [Ensete ventricosum]
MEQPSTEGRLSRGRGSGAGSQCVLVMEVASPIGYRCLYAVGRKKLGVVEATDYGMRSNERASVGAAVTVITGGV